MRSYLAFATVCTTALLTMLPLPKQSAQSTQQILSVAVANTYGFQRFKEIKSISYTFHVQKGNKKFQRSWRWEPKSGRVSFRQDPKKPWFHYIRSSSTLRTSKRAKKIDRGFINDRYWLLFPLHLVWDKAATIKTRVVKKPMKWGKYTLNPAYELSIQYPKQGGYTPGDLYKLYISKQKRIVAWSFHKGGRAKPNRRTTWEQTKAFGPLKISLVRNGIKGGFRIWFSGVSVKLAKAK